MGACDVHHAAVVIEQDLPGVDAVIAVKHFEDRALADAGRAAQHHAFAAGDGEGDVGDDRQHEAAAKVHDEALETSETMSGVAIGCLRLKYRGNEQLRVALARVVQHAVGQTLLDDMAILHHHHAVREKACDGEVMGDDDGGKAEVVDQTAQKIEQAGLNGHIKAAGRLVHEDETGRGHQIAGNLQALAHAAREGPWLVVDTVFGDFHAVQPVCRRLADPAIIADHPPPSVARRHWRRQRPTCADRRPGSDEQNPSQCASGSGVPPRSCGRDRGRSRRACDR